MKKFVTVLVVLFVLVGGGYIFFPKAPEMTGIKKIGLPNFGKKEVSIKVEAKFNNPNYYGLTLTGHDIDVYITDKKVGNVTQTEERLIPGKENFTIPLKITFDGSEVLGGQGFLKGLLSSFVDNDMTIRYKGTVTVKAFGLNIPVPIDYSEKLFENNLKSEE